MTVGRRRFKVVNIEAGDEPFLVADVEWLPEPTGEADVAAAERMLARTGWSTTA